MKVHTVNGFAELHQCLERYEQRFTMFRGVGDASYDLIPKISRPETMLLRKPHKTEKEMVRVFKERALPHLRYIPRNDWEWIALMQHHGVPTRLLDWTRNGLVAAYFAVEKPGAADCAIYAWRTKDRAIDVESEKDPFKVSDVRRFIPPHISERIIAQSGLFTIHPVPTSPMTSPTLEKIVIPVTFRKEIKNILFKYGIHRALLFPDLDGLASHVTWMHVESH